MSDTVDDVARSQARQSEGLPNAPDIPMDIGRVFRLIWFFAGIGIAALFIPALARGLSASEGESALALGFETAAAGLFVAGGATLVGSVLGFLFGVPQQKNDGEANASKYSPNTNLERVSDWLTKILIGAGVTQLGSITSTVGEIAAKIGPAFGDEPLGTVIGGALVLHYFVIGLFQGFLVAALWMPGAFRRAHEE